MNPINAVRSLQCEDHAVNLPPQELSIAWFLGKRCNYDCSYCSPHIHDAVSPFVDLDQAMAFVDRADAHCRELGKTVKWSFTGGEPFLDPSFVALLSHIGSKTSTGQINSISNASLPIGVYLETAKYLKGITFSLHLERSSLEIQTSLGVLEKLASDTDLFLSVNLMFLPGKMAQVRDLSKKLDRIGVPYVVRKIIPSSDPAELAPFVQHGPGRKNRDLLEVQQQSTLKRSWKIFRDREDGAGYYDASELEYLQNCNNRKIWQNMGIWTNDEYQEINSDLLVSRGQNQFQNWICYAGVDHINVDFDGNIYGGQCQNLGALGHISQSLPFRAEPMICQLKRCTCNTDIPIRKARNVGFLPLINHA